MEKLTKYLVTEFWCFVALTLLIVGIFEMGMIDAGGHVGRPEEVFVVSILMELVTIGLIPLALYLFHIKAVQRILKPANGLLSTKARLFGSLRIIMLGVPMVVNTVCYYLYGFNVRFGYLAIILFLASCFIYPSRGKCEKEFGIATEEQEDKENHAS